MNPDRHVSRRRSNQGIDDADIDAQQIAPVVAALGEQLPHARIAEFDQRRFVHLQISTAGLGQRAHFTGVGLHQVGPEGVEVGIDVAADIGPPGAVMNVARARQRDLRRSRGQRLEKTKIIGVLRSAPGDAPDDRWNAPRHPVAVAV
jgi:hypothetical protein